MIVRRRSLAARTGGNGRAVGRDLAREAPAVDVRDADVGRTQVLGPRAQRGLAGDVCRAWTGSSTRGEPLARRLHEALSARPGVEVLTPADAMATIVVLPTAVLAGR